MKKDIIKNRHKGQNRTAASNKKHVVILPIILPNGVSCTNQLC